LRYIHLNLNFGFSDVTVINNLNGRFNHYILILPTLLGHVMEKRKIYIYFHQFILHKLVIFFLTCLHKREMGIQTCTSLGEVLS
jgi:hypothetical protein